MDPSIDPSPVVVAFARTSEQAIDLLRKDVRFEAAESRPLIVSPAPPLPAAVRQLVDLADAALGSRVEVMFRPARLAAFAGLEQRWSDVPLTDGAERFERVRLPSRLAESRLVVVSGLATGDGIAESPVGLLAAFAHPRQRLVAAASRDDALMAELAAAVPLRLLLAAGTVGASGVAFSAPDLPSAQLLWAALTRPDDDGRAEVPVAWERPEVQRAVSLCPGPTRPHDLGIRLMAEARLMDRVPAMVDRLRMALGPVAIETVSG